MSKSVSTRYPFDQAHGIPPRFGNLTSATTPSTSKPSVSSARMEASSDIPDTIESSTIATDRLLSSGPSTCRPVTEVFGCFRIDRPGIASGTKKDTGTEQGLRSLAVGRDLRRAKSRQPVQQGLAGASKPSLGEGHAPAVERPRRSCTAEVPDRLVRRGVEDPAARQQATELVVMQPSRTRSIDERSRRAGRAGPAHGDESFSRAAA